MQQPEDQTWNGSHFLNGGPGTTGLPAGDAPVYDLDNDLIWWYEIDWTRSASSDLCTFSPDVRMQTLQYKAIFILLSALKLMMNLSLHKTQI